MFSKTLSQPDAVAASRSPESESAQCLPALLRDAQNATGPGWRARRGLLLRSVPIAPCRRSVCRARTGFVQGATVPDQDSPRSHVPRLHLLGNENEIGRGSCRERSKIV